MSGVSVLVDGHFLLHRVMHIETFTKFTSDKGVFTGGVFGFLSSLQMIFEKFSVERLTVVWDGGRSKRRMEILPEYKANREAKNEEEEALSVEYKKSFDDQKEKIISLLGKLRCRSITLDGKEGDDVLGLLASMYPLPTVIVTADKDFLQLVSDTTSVYLTDRSLLVNKENFNEVVGLSRKMFLLQKAMLGDKSDNIPGISGVGKTTVEKVMDKVVENLRPGVVVRDVIISACADLMESDKAGKNRYQKLVNGMETIKRNLALVDISKEPFTEDEKKEVSDEFNRPLGEFVEADSKSVMEEYGFKLFLSSWQSFLKPFTCLQ